jgi:hypothetical protein
MGGMCRIAHDKSYSMLNARFQDTARKGLPEYPPAACPAGTARRAPVGREAVQINAAHGCLRRARPCAASPAIIPASTSPLPPRARPAFPVRIFVQPPGRRGRQCAVALRTNTASAVWPWTAPFRQALPAPAARRCGQGAPFRRMRRDDEPPGRGAHGLLFGGKAAQAAGVQHHCAAGAFQRSFISRAVVSSASRPPARQAYGGSFGHGGERAFIRQRQERGLQKRARQCFG